MNGIGDSPDPGSPGSLIAALCDKLRGHYVFPERAEQMCQALQQFRDDLRTQQIASGDALAAALTARLHAVYPDRHLRVRWFAELPPESEPSPQARQQAQRLAAERDHHGIHRVERLAGQIGLLDLRQFHHPAWSGDSAVAAMNLLAPCQALIVDLRQCRGGEPSMVALFSSYLFDETPVHLNSLYERSSDSLQQFWTLPYVPGRRLHHQPVYVLCSHQTFSAAEEFAYNLQARRRATVVGEATRGGAHAGEIHRLDDHFAVFIPDARAVNPVTGGNWEGSGVIPDLVCPQQQALVQAHRLALQQLLARLDSGADVALSGLREEACAALAALPLP